MVLVTMRSVVLVLLGLVFTVSAWDDGDFEVFDVVEEVNQNFYELLGVKQDATPAEIKSAFKKLTLKLHPDKNDAPDADVQFRNLVSVHNVLKDPGKREKYNDVLKNGLPNWRSALYYYRHVRKMGLAEGAIILFILITLGQYAVGWAAYVEKRFTAESILTSRKKHSKKSGFDAGLAEILDQLPRPSVKDTLPFQVPRLMWWLVTAVPRGVQEYKRMKREKEEEARRQKKREEEERRREAREAQLAAEAKEKGARRRRPALPEAREPSCLLDPVAAPAPREPKLPPIVSGGLWTDDDLAELVRLVKKFPGGAPDRWETIANHMRRPVPEVTHMAAKMKDNCYKVPGQEPEPVAVEQPKKVKTRKEESSGGVWSQAQQGALEAALARLPRGHSAERWTKIAAQVPGKTKEECMQRCKYLSDLVRKQKQKEEEKQQEQVIEEPQVEQKDEPQSDQELEIPKKGRKSKKKRRKKVESSEEELSELDSE